MRDREPGAGAAMAAWCAIGVVNAVVIAVAIPLPKSGLWVRSLHHFYDAGQMIAMGLASAGAVALWHRFGPRRPLWGYAALAAASVAAGFALLHEDLFNFVQQHEDLGISPDILHPIATILVALGVPAAALLGRALARHNLLRLAGAAGAIALAAGNHFILHHDYPGAHFYMAAAAAALGAASIAGATLPFSREGRRDNTAPAAPAADTATASAPAPSRAKEALTRWIIPAVLALWGGAAIAAPPKNAVLVELLTASGSVVAPFLVRFMSRSSAEDAPIPEPLRPWFADRSSAPPTPPSAPRLLPDDGIVILLSIDAVRADVIASDKHFRALRGLATLRREAVEFTQARSPGSQTVYSLSTLFMGTYFSQQYWTPLVEPTRRHLWPHEDPSPRVPEILAAAGIPAVNVGAAYWMTNPWGIARGFTEERAIATGKKYAAAADMMTAAIERLKQHKGGPLFLFMHLLDPHAPYDRGSKEGTPFNRYIAEIALVDQEIRRLRGELAAAGLAQRTALIVTADHGEAFGEHGLQHHATTLYDELLRVPLLILVPGVKPRQVREPVSLVDLGPTILDLLGAPTPGHFMGQSLAPFLRGESPKLTRPILAEGRLKRAIVFPDGVKVITDERHGTIEVYDLRADPDETRNLFNEENETAERAAILRAFFAERTIKRSGYRVPYRR
jgi:hypothetical protein